MKKRLLQIILLFLPFWAASQNVKTEKTGEDYQNYFTIQTGLGMTGAVLADLKGSSASTSSGPNLYLNYEYMPTASRFSANICIGMSTGRLSNTNYLNQQVITRGRILTWSSRGLVHFLHKKSIKHDLYTGLGLGIGLVSLKGPNDDKFELSSTDVQFILPFYAGYRYFFKNSLGATIELSTFKNCMVSAGLTFRF